MKEILNFINGEYVSTGNWFDKFTPYDGRLIARVAEAGRAEVDAAVRAAREALHGPWSKLAVADRSELLYAVADEINRRFDDFVEAEITDMGQPEQFVRHVDVPRGAANFKVFADIVKNVPNEFFEMTTPDGRGALNYSLRRPVGHGMWQHGGGEAVGRDAAGSRIAGRGDEQGRHPQRSFQCRAGVWPGCCR